MNDELHNGVKVVCQGFSTSCHWNRLKRDTEWQHIPSKYIQAGQVNKSALILMTIEPNIACTNIIFK